jgi:GT2 family glycosyltransferase
MRPEISYVIPVYNKGPETTNYCRRALESIRKFSQKFDYEIIVIDNDSPDHQGKDLQYLRETLYGGAIVVSLPYNIGFGHACNMGFRLAQGEFVICMNSDAELVEDSPAILRPIMDRYNLQVAFPESYEGCKHYNLQKSDELMWNWYFGAWWMGRTHVIRQVGGFDADTFKMCYYEDTDLWTRLNRIFPKGVAGWRGTWVKHAGGASSLPQMSELFYENQRKYEEKWGTTNVIRYDESGKPITVANQLFSEA